ncbi:hypothetical protein PV08_12100 [Exophiala spinifera]|uniref:Uncharacterized protein n=1 Tax=Exophiala spinifera TaxID=91928 RepID=A0A0D1Y3Y5_9EURO|nr:uncharacterized protein PV08_12100 [Exophiala spinifera]KIW09651.1 hypothetical protein PV08_12100 [Exophiala spinifera]
MVDTPAGVTFIAPSTPLKKPELDTIGEVMVTLSSTLNKPNLTYEEKEDFLTAFSRWLQVTADRHDIALEQGMTSDDDSNFGADDEGAAKDEDDDEDVIALGKRKTGSGKDGYNDDEESEIALQAITVTLSPDLSFAAMNDLRDRFVQKLQAIRISKGRRLVNSNGDVISRKGLAAAKIDIRECQQIANYIFTDMFGQPALVRLAQLIEHVSHPSGGGDPNVVERAIQAANDAKMPRVLRALFAAWAKAEAADVKTNSFHRAILGNVALLDILTLYNNLITTLDKGRNTKARRMLENAGLKTSRGRGWKSLVGAGRAWSESSSARLWGSKAIMPLATSYKRRRLCPPFANHGTME